jgi:hypothetical protein
LAPQLSSGHSGPGGVHPARRTYYAAFPVACFVARRTSPCRPSAVPAPCALYWNQSTARLGRPRHLFTTGPRPWRWGWGWGGGGGVSPKKAPVHLTLSSPCCLCVAAALPASEALALGRPRRYPGACAAGKGGPPPWGLKCFGFGIAVSSLFITVACTSQVLVCLLMSPPTGGTHSASRSHGWFGWLIAVHLALSSPCCLCVAAAGSPHERSARVGTPPPLSRGLCCGEGCAAGKGGPPPWVFNYFAHRLAWVCGGTYDLSANADATRFVCRYNPPQGRTRPAQCENTN